jgi:hypothetical protein
MPRCILRVEDAAPIDPRRVAENLPRHGHDDRLGIVDRMDELAWDRP